MKNFCECESAKIVMVIKTISTRGDGTSADPSRFVTKYWDLDGKLLFEKDAFISTELFLNPEK